MNTYDFDKTIFNPDSSYKFFLYCLKKYPKTARRLPKTAVYAIKRKLGLIQTKELKEQVFSFLRDIRDIDNEVESFWKLNYPAIEKWYLKQKRSDDIIISASPEFLLKPVCEKLGVSLIATRMDKETGKITGENCHDHEKVVRFYAEYPGAHTECFYSDSLTDSPMAEIADRAFLVDKDKLSPWPGKS